MTERLPEPEGRLCENCLREQSNDVREFTLNITKRLDLTKKTNKLDLVLLELKDKQGMLGKIFPSAFGSKECREALKQKAEIEREMKDLRRRNKELKDRAERRRQGCEHV